MFLQVKLKIKKKINKTYKKLISTDGLKNEAYILFSNDFTIDKIVFHLYYIITYC